MTEEELDVISAADDYWELCEQAKYGEVRKELFRLAEKAILGAVGRLHDANDGRWRRQ